MGATTSEFRSGVIRQTLTASSVATGSTGEYTFTVPGLKTNDVVVVNRPSSQSNVAIGGTRVSANDTLAVTYFNLSTTASATPTSEEYKIFWYRAENLDTSARG
jgi:hypothetical protein